MSTKKCSICNNTTFAEVLFFDKGFMSDGTPTDSPLVKEECMKCGTVRTRVDFDWEAFYSNQYCPSRNLDTPVLQTNNTENTRSSFVFDWITSLLEKSGYTSNFQTMLEIGCGQGYLLEKFDVDQKFGIEPSKDASTEASKKANIRNIGFENISESETYDLLLSYCVIEHIAQPELFLNKTKDILAPDGLMILALPIQDKFNYDLFFMDHLYHFSHENLRLFLAIHGFEIVNFELGKDAYSNIGLYLCKHAPNLNDPLFQFNKNKNISYVKTVIKAIDELHKEGPDHLYAFGYGEIAKTVIPYTPLDQVITSYIDDFNVGDRVISSSDAKKIFLGHSGKSFKIVLLVNPNHQEKIKQLFDGIANLSFINIFKGIPIE